MNFLILFTLFLLSSCANKFHLKSGDEVFLLKKIKITGNGKCRLTLAGQQDLFSCEALIQNENTWLVAISIPFRGEELMMLPSLDQEILNKNNLEDFEYRIAERMKLKKEFQNITASQILQSLHSAVRFLASETIHLNRNCRKEETQKICNVGSIFYDLKIVKDKLILSTQQKKLNNSDKLSYEIIAENLTNSDFKKTSFHLYNSKSSNENRPLISFEFFWN